MWAKIDAALAPPLLFAAMKTYKLKKARDKAKVFSTYIRQCLYVSYVSYKLNKLYSVFSNFCFHMLNIRIMAEAVPK
jgi:hypothetical protein